MSLTGYVLLGHVASLGCSKFSITARESKQRRSVVSSKSDGRKARPPKSKKKNASLSLSISESSHGEVSLTLSGMFLTTAEKPTPGGSCASTSMKCFGTKAEAVSLRPHGKPSAAASVLEVMWISMSFCKATAALWASSCRISGHSTTMPSLAATEAKQPWLVVAKSVSIRTKRNSD